MLTQFAIPMVGTRLLYQVDWGPWPHALLLGNAFSVAAAGIGTAAAGFFPQPRTADAAIGKVGMLFGALSGAMMPLYLFPDGLRAVARFIPNYWALQGFLDRPSGGRAPGGGCSRPPTAGLPSSVATCSASS